MKFLKEKLFYWKNIWSIFKWILKFPKENFLWMKKSFDFLYNNFKTGSFFLEKGYEENKKNVKNTLTSKVFINVNRLWSHWYKWKWQCVYHFEIILFHLSNHKPYPQVINIHLYEYYFWNDILNKAININFLNYGFRVLDAFQCILLPLVREIRFEPSCIDAPIDYTFIYKFAYNFHSSNVFDHLMNLKQRFCYGDC
jgi:hypothetical protein